MNMKKIILTALILFSSLSLSFAQPKLEPKPYYPQRIVSTLPSSTEMLFALGAGYQVVGVTRFCKYPPEAQKKTIIGGLLDVNYEIIYSLNPDLAIIQSGAAENKNMFDKMKIPTLEIETRSMEGIIKSIRDIGAATGRIKEAEEVAGNIEKKIQFIQSKVSGLKTPRVLVTFLRPVGDGEIHDVYIAGNHTFFQDIIKIVGGQNAYDGNQFVTSPVVNAEGIIQMKPDVIIELMGDLPLKDFSVEKALKDWDMLSELDAYKNKRIYIMDKQYAGIPGPRITLTLDEIARYVHPEVNWDKE